VLTAPLFNLVFFGIPWIVALVLLWRVRIQNRTWLRCLLGAQAAAFVTSDVLTMWLMMTVPGSADADAAYQQYLHLRRVTFVPLAACASTLLIVCAWKFRRAVARSSNDTGAPSSSSAPRPGDVP
jgi:hypothetical protein